MRESGSAPTSSELTEAYGRFRAILLSVIVFSFFVNLLMFVGPLYMLQIYDRVLSSRNETTLVLLTVIAIALLMTYGLLEFVRSRMLVRAGLQFDAVLAEPLFSRAVRLQLDTPTSDGSHALADADRVREFVTGQGVLAFFDAPWVPLFLLLCFAFHPLLGVVAAIGAGLIFVLALLNGFLTRGSLETAGRSGSDASGFAAAALQNAEVIRAMAMKDALLGRWLGRRDRMLAAQARASDRAGAVLACSKFVRLSLQVAILGVGAWLAMAGEISAGIMIAASIVMGRALAPVEQAVGQWRHFVAARQAHARLGSLFATFPSETGRTLMPDPQGRLSVTELIARLPDAQEPVLLSVSFDLEPGETCAVVGPSGSGKSMLVRHLTGVLTPSSGSVRLDGTDLRHWDRKQLGCAMGYLPQDIRLFGGTVAQNIARFRDDAEDADIVASAQLAGAHDMIAGLVNGYETEVGDGGFRLSGGQRQRVALARAVFGLPVVVVLDEPNSNLDSEGEAALAACLKRLKAMGRTVIVATHAAGLLSLTDRTLVVDNGRVRRLVATGDLLQPQHAVAHRPAPPLREMARQTGGDRNRAVAGSAGDGDEAGRT